jgi:ubiquinone/menaquinone biosynthesis C-methylase UbiE
MLAEASKLATERGLSNMETAAADAEKLPFGDGSFDLVTCRIAPHHFSDIEAFLRESRRVLKSGGVFALVDNVSPDAETAPGFSQSELDKAARAYNAFEKLRDPSHGRALTTPEWLHLMAAAGLEVLHKEHAPKAMDFAAWCKNMAASDDCVSQLQRMLEEASPALRAYLQPRHDGGKLAFTLAELIAIARKS